MKAYIFPGQGAQFSGMGKDLYEKSDKARQYFQQANEVLGYDLADIMFNGSAEDLKQTRVTQPAIFVHSVILAKLQENFNPQMVAGHSLGEFSALVAAGALKFDDGLQLVYKRAMAMQAACEATPSTMAAVLGLEDKAVEEACAAVQGEVVVAANYNLPGQLVISGSFEGVAKAGELLKERGAKRVLPLQVGGAFHSPLMEPAREELQAAILKTSFSQPICPIYQNVNAGAATDTKTIQQNLIAQLTAPVRWTQTIQNMVAGGATEFIECGPGKVLQGLVKKIHPEAQVGSVEY
ncbi:MAG: ACP S-malonyltransferase [Bacteroidetes bacterium]|nr:ACP S-malonyltransferase [Bacteroidota bacterium]